MKISNWKIFIIKFNRIINFFIFNKESAVPVLVILSPTRANKKYGRNLIDYSIGLILWKQISFTIILKQVVGSDSQCLSPLETKFAKFEGAL